MVDDAEPEFGPTAADSRGEFPGGSWVVASAIEGWRWNARAHERGAFCGCCGLLSKTRAGDSSDTFKRKVMQEWANPLCPSKAEATNEVDDGYTLSVVQKRQRSKSREFWDA